MGSTISLEDPELNPEIAKDFHSIRISDIIEIAGCINDVCFGKSHLNKFDFEDIFSLSLNNAPIFFETLKQKVNGYTEEVVSIYEAIVAMAFLCKDQYEMKIAYIFNIFDFDQSFDLSRSQIELTMATACEALSKLLKVATPTEHNVNHCSNVLLKVFATNLKNSVTIDEILEYLNAQYEIQDFLLTYTCSTSHENAKRRFEEKFLLAENVYQSFLETDKDAELELSMSLASIFSIRESYVND